MPDDDAVLYDGVDVDVLRTTTCPAYYICNGHYDKIRITYRGQYYLVYVDERSVGDVSYTNDIKYDLQDPNCDPQEMARTILMRIKRGVWLAEDKVITMKDLYGVLNERILAETDFDACVVGSDRICMRRNKLHLDIEIGEHIYHDKVTLIIGVVYEYTIIASWEWGDVADPSFNPEPIFDKIVQYLIVYPILTG